MSFRAASLGKKGEEIVMPEIILIILTIMFFGILLVFIAKAASSTLFYEELYAKKIALSIEAAKPGMVLEFDISKPYLLAKENKFDINNFFYFDEAENSVTVKLSSDGGYKFRLMSTKSVLNQKINLDFLNEKYILQVVIGE